MSRVFSSKALRGVTSDGCVVHVNKAEAPWCLLTGLNKGEYDLAIIFEDDAWCGWHADVLFAGFTLHVDGTDCLDYVGTLDEKVDYIKCLVLNTIITSTKYISPIQNIINNRVYNIKHLIIRDTMFDIA